MLGVNPQADFFALSGSTTNVANGASTGVVTMRNTSGQTFYGQRLRIVAKLNAAGGGALAGTPLANAPSATLANNTFYPDSLVTINVKVGNHTYWTQNISLQALHMDDQGRSFKFDTVMPKVEADQDCIVSITNNSGVAIDVDVHLPGFIVPKGQQPLVNI